MQYDGMQSKKAEHKHLLKAFTSKHSASSDGLKQADSCRVCIRVYSRAASEETCTAILGYVVDTLAHRFLRR